MPEGIGGPPPPGSENSPEFQQARREADDELVAGLTVLQKLASRESLTANSRLKSELGELDADLGKFEFITQGGPGQPARKVGGAESLSLDRLAVIRLPLKVSLATGTAPNRFEAAFGKFRELARELGAPLDVNNRAAIEARSTEHQDRWFARVQGSDRGKAVEARLGLISTEGRPVQIRKRAGEWYPRLTYDRKIGVAGLEFYKEVVNPNPRGRRRELLDEQGRVYTVSSDERELQNGW